MLIGLVAKNGILIVEFANQKQEAGEDKMSAIKDAALQRLRPILMTSAVRNVSSNVSLAILSISSSPCPIVFPSANPAEIGIK